MRLICSDTQAFGSHRPVVLLAQREAQTRAACRTAWWIPTALVEHSVARSWLAWVQTAHAQTSRLRLGPLRRRRFSSFRVSWRRPRRTMGLRRCAAACTSTGVRHLLSAQPKVQYTACGLAGFRACTIAPVKSFTRSKVSARMS